jgi:hypothetical protein
MRIKRKGSRTYAVCCWPHAKTAMFPRSPPTKHFVDRVLRALSFRAGRGPIYLARIGVSGQLKRLHIVRLQFEGASKFFKGIVVLPFSEIVKTTKRDVLRHD